MLEEKKSHSLILSEQTKLNMSGVTSADGLNQSGIEVTTSSGKIQITGENLKIVAFTKESGNLEVEGKIFEIKYKGEKKPLVKRLFK